MDVARIPDRAEYRRQWAQLQLADRRRIIKAVNRGQTLDRPQDAALAVMTARSQKRFWTWAWLLGPVSSLFVLFQDAGFAVWAANAVLITLVMGALSFFWYRRADRAETANLEAARGKRQRQGGRGAKGASKPAHKPGRSHTPKGGRKR